ncbi:hypothetical protein [Zooshikella harenae]|uniref:Uncharacterized protein n=1 Tax=Zooshikella harenae TaxID=2827238 RepID=A0ABS5ZHP3_9GAMM|nr:hypothetical protein [Zooshikella harenae]MBU2713588.1 hypothetical protein [Zooshikella harenae]
MRKLLLLIVSLMVCPAMAYQLEFAWYESHDFNCENREDTSKDTKPPTEPNINTFRKLLTTTVAVNSTGFFHRYIETPPKKTTLSGSIIPHEIKFLTAQLYMIEFSNDSGPSTTELTTILEKNKRFILNSEQVCTQPLTVAVRQNP